MKMQTLKKYEDADTIETEGGKIKRFYAYFNPKRFGRDFYEHR